MAQSGAGGVTYDATREVRFAVVLYGGVSLAIYIDGVVRELLNLVWATAPAGKGGLRWPTPTSGVVGVYRELGQRLVDGTLRPETGGPVRTRFVVDVIAGASAGGINGVCLAKALACDLDISQLDDLWVQEADIADLINDRGSETKAVTNERPPEALLSGRRMQYLLLKALHGMNDGPKDARGEATGDQDAPAERDDRSPSPYADAIDLFVTATDLKGRRQEVMLTDQPAGPVAEVVHRTVFRFMYGRPEAIGGEVPINQFSAAYDPMLAFAARATASFPGAFQPTCLDDLDSVLGAVYPNGLAGVEAPDSEVLRRFFFGRYGDDYRKVCFADGGYLDNKPFEPTLDVLPHRRADLPVDRKLLYVEPDPSISPGEGLIATEADRPSLLDAVVKVATIPRVETIGSDISRIRSFGQLAAGRRAVYDRIRSALDAALGPVPEVPAPPPEPDGVVVNVAVLDGGDTVAGGSSTAEGAGGGEPAAPGPSADAGVQLATAAETTAGLTAQVTALAQQAPTRTAYLELRVTRTLRDLGEVLARIVRDEVHDTGSVVHTALEQAARTWRAAKHVSTDRVLSGYDLRFALDRINFVQARVRDRQGDTPGDRDDDRLLLDALDQAYAELRGRGRAIRLPGPDNPARDEIDHLRDTLDGGGDSDQSVADVLGESSAALDAFDALVGALSAHLDLENATLAHQRLLLGHPNRARLLRDWACFSFYDEAAGPLRDELPGENDSIEVHRLSPYDTRAIVPDPVLHPKLAGSAIHHFGGFFHEDWRRNDILWGRLDTAERIVTTLVPEAPAAEQEDLIERAQLAILEELFSDDGWRRWLRARFPDIERAPEDHRAAELHRALGARPRVDTRPEQAASVALGARAARVASQVVDHLADGPRPVPGARSVGRALRLVANVVDLLIPGRLKTLVWQRVLVLVIVAAGITAFGGFILGLDQVRTFGLVTLVAAVGVRVVSDIAVRRIEGVSRTGAWLLRTVVGVLLVLAILGGNAVARRDDGWQYALVGLAPAAVTLVAVIWMGWRFPPGVPPGRIVTWRRVAALAVILLLTSAASLAVVAITDWDATWDSFRTLIGT